ncbi:ANK-REP-REGION domain-containing protein [Mycena sanguinolenta]|uniref:ANK-REP-REGION domain-containing protein n=1 Tax=Mycena sanguinolenta TaxID=230812 RepID=A0A8H6XL40_9AGAR|nr:ANK-REP-REGION domain-containing protein [Mycena sanguinolenta]
MADIVGLVASILQLVETIKTTRDYIHTFRNAPNQQKLLLVEIQSLEPLLKELDDRIQRSQAGGSTSGLQKFEEPLIELRTVVEQLMKKLHRSGRWNFSRLTWSLWGKEDVQEGFDIVERFKGLVAVWLELDIWDFARETARKYHDDTLTTIREATEEQRNDHDDIFRSVRDMAQNQEQYYNAAERDVVIEWYSPLNFFLRQADIFRLHQPGTGQWFLEMSMFKEWKCGVGKALWCPGMPGAGKTVLVSIAVEHLRSEEHFDNIGVAAIYLNHKETDTHTPSTLLTSLWRQLVIGKSIALVGKLYQKHREPGTKPTVNVDHAILCSTISEYSKVFILVDALDEYPERERDIFMSYLSQLGANVNLLLTSRPHIRLNRRIPQMEVLEIEATEPDIRCYIDAQILKSPRLSKHIQNCPDLLEQIEDRIVRRSDGMFLMAKLHIDSLSGKHTVKAVQAALKTLPNDLESTYNEVIERINRQSEDDRDLALRTLSWICNAQRLLRPSELREALAVEPGTTELDPNNLLDMETILSVCAGLVLVDARDNRIRLVHFTAQNYLERKQAVKFPHASTQIALTCIEYLSFNTFQQRPENPLALFHKHPFLDYAVEYCLVHARGEAEFHIMPSIVSFLAATETGWWELWNWKHRYRKEPTSGSPLLIAALFGLEEICQDIIETDGAGNALQLAVAEGLTDVVQFLIRNGIDVQGNEGPFDSALHAAACHGRGNIISLLLANGVDIESRGASGTALQVAAHFGQKESVELLIACGANVNAPGGFYGPALYAAASKPAYDIFCQLIAAGAGTGLGLRMPSSLEEGASVMASVLIAGDGGIHNALQTALAAQNEAALRILLAECNRHDDDAMQYSAALSEPFAQGARLLLDSEIIQREINTLPSRFDKPGIDGAGLMKLQGIVPNEIPPAPTG